MTLSNIVIFRSISGIKKHLTNLNRRNLSHRAQKFTAPNLPVLTQRRILLTGRIDRLNTPGINILAGFTLLIHRSHPNALQRSSERAQYTAGSYISHVWESLNYIHPQSPAAPHQQQHHHPLLTPVSRCQRLLFAHRLKRASTRPPPTLLDRREYLSELAFLCFSRSFWLCQDRLEHNLGWNRASGREKEHVNPRVVLSRASKESEC